VSKITEILDKLNDHAPAVIDIPARNGEHYRCKAMFVKKENLTVELVFPPNSWDADNLALGTECTVAVEHDGRDINILACLDQVTSDRRLQFTAKEPVSLESLREYFRVAIHLPIEASYIAGPREVNGKTWKMLGTTIDLSGSGVLAVLADKPPTTHNIQIVITMPEDEPSIVCLADVVRTYRLRKSRYQVAFHFEVVSTKTRDQIISCCLQEQRRQLRELALNR